MNMAGLHCLYCSVGSWGHSEAVPQDNVEVESKDKYGRTPLSYAAIMGHKIIVRLLLAQDNVKVDFKDYRNRTPLSYAAGNGHRTIVKLLLTQDNVGLLFLQLSCSWNICWTSLSASTSRVARDTLYCIFHHIKVS